MYADDTSHVKDFKYFTKFKRFAEISDVINGKAEGRSNNKERIIVYNIGIAMHDIYFAEKIFRLMANDVKDISLNAPKQKFWL